jgi:large subunit ribosomal protein L25
MERVKIEVNLREKVGKEAARKARQQGNVPAIVYGRDVNIPLIITSENFKILRAIDFSESAIIDMQIVNGKKKDIYAVIIKDIQYHPLTEEVLHIDFMKVSLEERIRVHVHLVFKGEPKGIKAGGVLEQVLRDLEIEGLPLDIPDKIEVDISELDIGDSLHAGDIKIPLNLKLLTHYEDTVVTVVAKKEEEEEVAVAEGVTPEEPEVIKEKKEEEKEEKEEKKKE